MARDPMRGVARPVEETRRFRRSAGRSPRGPPDAARRPEGAA